MTRRALVTAAAALAIAGGLLAPAQAHASGGCGTGEYLNSSGQCVPDPENDGNTAPAGATAKCRDGDYSFSKHHTGTCSGHGGVAQWL
ncbi:DUF3761 domain-containing protein [Gordonia sp. TBRC 11910]|uniref:DUF3761 domain-containing protein n=1 Tax=Gordonia asplenii TaxID=2725283 RepID=A0A848L2I8_9ACTN|nr:DUF3761 domain-containing protein [Gordonia asplenii]NMO01868.1 DUF3761 domain-containing protein [Gordonia asplenii]